MRRNDLERVTEAQEHLRILRSHLQRGDLGDGVVFDAVCLRLAAAIECVAAIEPSARSDVFGMDWPAIVSVRNRIAHRYLSVDRAIIDATVATDLPEFESKLAILTDRLSARGAEGEG